uniref:Uncharacterized protein n=1 Tax=Lepeophtheirus salmonis TaxID=72036 RepID=A0A0K2VF39_LEPSM
MKGCFSLFIRRR